MASSLAETSNPRCGLGTRADPLMQSGSWADLVKGYKQTKSSVPWSGPQPVDRVTRHQKSREERNFDPILGRFRDTARESTHQRAEQERTTQALNHAKLKQLRYTQKFDIINHASKVSGAMPGSGSLHDSSLQMPQSRVPYNILNNVPHGGERSVVRPSTVGGPTKQRPGYDKDFNVITNRYHTKHTSRQGMDEAHRREDAATRFWKTHDFNPVSCTFYDKDKESNHWGAVKAAEKTHGQAQKARLPPSAQNCEGAAYNPVSMVVVDQAKMKERDEKEKSMNRSRGKTEFEDKVKKAQSDAYELEVSRKINRVSHTRYVEMKKNGYDIVFTRSYLGRGSKEIPPAQMVEPASVWKKVEAAQTTGPIHRGKAPAPPVYRPSTSVSSNRAPDAVPSPGLPGLGPTPRAATAASGQRSSRSARPESDGGGGGGSQLGSARRSFRGPAVPDLNLSQTLGSGRVRTGGFS